MFGLIDCNNFYVSCERVFNPALNNHPVMVLSNNDGCVISRSNEVKDLGIGMAVPTHEVKDLIKKHNIAVFSSNYTLYADMSNRVMNLLQGFVDEVEIYSIDEAFLNLAGMEHFNIKEYAEKITNTVYRGTGLPVSMGIAKTKTLAKVANKYAKKYPKYNNVCYIDTEDRQIKALKITKIEDVWGIGRRFARKLKEEGIITAYDFIKMPRAWVRKNMTVVGERVWCELQGEPCIELELVTPAKQQFCTSRMFGERLNDIGTIREAISTYACLCSEKLRQQQSSATSLMVFICSTNGADKRPYYFPHKLIEMPVPTDSTLEIVKYALIALDSIYSDKYRYKKGGVILTEVISNTAIQQNLFDTVDRKKHADLMQIMDKLNSGFAQNVLKLAVQGTSTNWNIKRDYLSKCYSTNLNDIIIANCKRDKLFDSGCE